MTPDVLRTLSILLNLMRCFAAEECVGRCHED